MKIKYPFIVLLFVFSAIIALAQDYDTATPGPTKTPTLSPSPTETLETAVTSTPAAITTSTTNADYALARAFTQEDLNTLVGNVQRPNGLAYLDGDLYAACNGDWTLYRIDSETGATETFIFGVQNVHAMVAESTEAGFSLWIPDFDTNRLLLVDQRQVAPDVILTENLDGPWGITPVGEENFLITNIRANNMILANRNGDSMVVMEGLRSPASIVIDDEVAYITNNGSARRAIEWFNMSEIATTFGEDPVEPVSDITQPLITGLQNASGMVLAEDGFLYFTYALGTRGVVGRINPDQCREETCTNEDIEIVLFTELPAPLAGLTITPDFRLFVHTIYRPEIYWLQLYQ